MRKLATDIAYILRQLNPGRAIFLIDSTSWRKNITIVENEGYKGNREKDPRLNWTGIFKLLDEFREILTNNGFIVHKIESAEADDLMALWAHELLYGRKEHVILISGDEDITQLVLDNEYEPGKHAFSVVFNPFLQGKNATKKVHHPHNFIEWLDTEENIDIFNMSGDVDKEDFNRLRKDVKIKFGYVDAEYVSLYKILCGDDGDNVPAFYSWLKTTKKGKEAEERITDGKFEKILTRLELKTVEMLNNKSKLDQLEGILTEMSGHVPRFDITDRYWRQRKLVHLDTKIFPENIIKKFNQEKDAYIMKPRTYSGSISMQEMLVGTKYVTEKKEGKEASIFADTDSIIKALF
jgi:5'-3' exonuclease